MDLATVPGEYLCYAAFLSPSSRERGLKPMTDVQCRQYVNNACEALDPEWVAKLARCPYLNDQTLPENKAIVSLLMTFLCHRAVGV